MRVVALEEHFTVPELIIKAGLKDAHTPAMKPAIQKALADLGWHRLDAMDEGEITLQVLSAAAPGAEQLDGTPAIEFAHTTNNTLAKAITQHPGRFAGFAHLPMRNPTAAATELARAVLDLGFKGALVNGTTSGLFLDHERFAPLLKQAENLDVPLYLHPALPPEPVLDAYYRGLPENRGQMLAMAGFGWHAEVAVHVLRLALAGTFERHPQLKIIIGHMGETLPFMLERSEQVFASQANPISIKSQILEHVWITTSGFFTVPPFLNALATFGPDRILFSVDYPFSHNPQGRDFLKALPVSEVDRLKIASGNADRLLGLSP